MAKLKPVKRIKLSGGKREVIEAPSKAVVEKQVTPKSLTDNETPKVQKAGVPPSGSIASILFTPFNYVADSWRELKQVRWPSRRATWVLTLAVILFSLFFTGVILLLDTIFQYGFREIILK